MPSSNRSRTESHAARAAEVQAGQDNRSTRSATAAEQQDGLAVRLTDDEMRHLRARRSQ